MQQLTDEEREELKRLSDEGYKYLARDECNSLHAYMKKPEKYIYTAAPKDYWGNDEFSSREMTI